MSEAGTAFVIPALVIVFICTLGFVFSVRRDKDSAIFLGYLTTLPIGSLFAVLSVLFMLGVIES